MHISKCAVAAALHARRPVFYYVTDRRRLTGTSLIACMRRAIRWGVEFIQIREKDLTDLELFEVTRRAVALTRGSRCGILVNGRADIAFAAGAHGVHLPSTGLRIGDLPAALTRNLILGVSAHSLREARRAERQGAHYILLGPLYPTESKLPYGPPLGLARFRRICRAVRIPVLALGGIQPDLILPALAAGAAGIAGIGLFQAKYLPPKPYVHGESVNPDARC